MLKIRHHSVGVIALLKERGANHLIAVLTSHVLGFFFFSSLFRFIAFCVSSTVSCAAHIAILGRCTFIELPAAAAAGASRPGGVTQHVQCTACSTCRILLRRLQLAAHWWLAEIPRRRYEVACDAECSLIINYQFSRRLHAR